MPLLYAEHLYKAGYLERRIEKIDRAGEIAPFNHRMRFFRNAM